MMDTTKYGSLRNAFHRLENGMYSKDTDDHIFADGSYRSLMRQVRWEEFKRTNSYLALPEIALSDTHRDLIRLYLKSSHSVDVAFDANSIFFPTSGQGRSVPLACHSFLRGFVIALHHERGHIDDTGAVCSMVMQADIMKGVKND